MHEHNGSMPKACIVYVGGDDKFSSLTTSFTEAGYSLVPHGDAHGADIGLIDLRGSQTSPKKIQTICGLLRKSSPELSILILIDTYIDHTARRALRRHGELVTMLSNPDGLIERCRQLLRLRNIAEEAGERLKTLASMSRLNEFPTISAPTTPLKVLIAGTAGPEALAAINALRPVTEQCVCVFSAGQAMRAAENTRFDCAVFLPAKESDPLLSLARALRRHPKHAGMPIIFPVGDPDHASDFVKRGASDFIYSNHIGADLAMKVQITARRARLLRTMRRFLQACAGDGIRDSASGAFTASFLAEHGARLCARSDQTNKPLALIALKIEAVSKEHGEPEPGRRALHQASRLINRLTRAEDAAARIAPDTFAVLAPATTEQNATRAAMRIKGVLENTVFRSVNDKLLYGAQVTAITCAHRKGYCIEESVALALTALREQAQAKPLSLQSPQ